MVSIFENHTTGVQDTAWVINMRFEEKEQEKHQLITHPVPWECSFELRNVTLSYRISKAQQSNKHSYLSLPFAIINQGYRADINKNSCQMTHITYNANALHSYANKCTRATLHFELNKMAVAWKLETVKKLQEVLKSLPMPDLHQGSIIHL